MADDKTEKKPAPRKTLPVPTMTVEFPTPAPERTGAFDPVTGVTDKAAAAAVPVPEWIREEALIAGLVRTAPTDGVELWLKVVLGADAEATDYERYLAVRTVLRTMARRKLIAHTRHKEHAWWLYKATDVLTAEFMARAHGILAENMIVSA